MSSGWFKMEWDKGEMFSFESEQKTLIWNYLNPAFWLFTALQTNGVCKPVAVVGGW